jgi:hypothetical protein
MMPGFVHHAELKIDAAAAPDRLRRIQNWCADWQIDDRVLGSLPGSDFVQLAFEYRSLARAVIGHFGGVLIDEDAIDDNARGEGAYNLLAGEFPD